MKRYLLLFTCMLSTIWASAQFSGSGSGTENDPYLIFNPIQLNQIRGFLNQKVYFKLMSDIDLTEWINENNPSQGWQPIGTSSTPFKGVLDGGDHTISGLVINRTTTEYVGFFADLYGATIKNITVNGNVLGSSRTGGISGKCEYASKLTNVTFNGSVTGNDYVGGLVGETSDNNSFAQCSFNGNLTGEENVGGIVGFGAQGSTTDIVSCFTCGTISGSKYIGGLAGHLNRHSISGSGAITSINSSDGYTGGIMGSSDHMSSNDVISRKVDHCFSVGSIHSDGDNVGGIIGYDYGYYYNRQTYGQSGSASSICNCYSSGAIQGKDNIGGIVGYAHQSHIDKCYSTGSIFGNQNIGGIAGYICTDYMYSLSPSILSCVSIHSDVNAITSGVGRIYGKQEKGSATIGEIGSQTGNLGLGTCRVVLNGVLQDIQDDKQNGTSTGRSTLKVRGTYQAIGWNFNDDWNILDTECYPYAKTQMAPPVIESGCFSGSTQVSGKSVNGGTVYLSTNGKTYKGTVNDNKWTIETAPLQGGAKVEVYADDAAQIQSYIVTQDITYPGKGTQDDPYQIYTAADLANANGNYYYKLMNNVDLTDYISANSPNEGWIPIGKGGSVMAQFDGNGHTISGLWINSEDDYVGLFSNASGATIKNLKVLVASGKKVKGGNYTGGIIGRCYNSTIENCSLQGNVEGKNYTGGIVGSNDNSQSQKVKVSGNVTGTINVGGIAGYTGGGSIAKALYNGNVQSTTASAYVGGISGSCNSAISQCCALGTVSATATGSIAGGVVGKNEAGGSVSDSYSTSEVTSYSYVGGVIGYNYGSIENCYAQGNLKSSVDFGGGVVGYNDGNSATTKHCVAINSKIEIADELGWASRVIGGLKNGAPTPDMNNYAYKEMVISINGIPMKLYDDNLNGTAKTIETLKSQSTYEAFGWDFNNVWAIEEGSDYPYLKNVGNISSEGQGDDDDNPQDPSTPIEPTDISSFANVIYAEKTEAQSGTQIALPIDLKNVDSFVGFQFDLYLPNGITVEKDEYEDPVFERTDRISTKITLEASAQTDGSTRFLCYSAKNYTLTGTEGEILNVTLNIPEDMEEGEYPVYLKNVIMNKEGNEKVQIDEVISTLSISAYTPGDADNDGSVDVVDIGCVASHILGNTSPTFNSKAADYDQDGSIDVVDIGGIASYILGGAAKVKSEWLGSRMDETPATMSIAPLSIAAGESKWLDIVLQNTDYEVCGSQFDITLPQGLSFVADAEGNPILEGQRSSAHCTEGSLKNETLKVLSYSAQNDCYSGKEGAIVSILVKADKDYSEGNGYIELRNILLARISGQGVSKVSLNNIHTLPTSLASIEETQESTIYNLKGWKLATPQKGVNIINGKKTFIK